MIFNYTTFLKELENNPLKEHVIHDYLAAVGELNKGEIESEVWYNMFVADFEKVSDYHVPEEIITEFDWGLLSQLAASSLSTDVGFQIIDGQKEMRITVKSDGKMVSRVISELWGFQILTIFHLWVEEQINLCVIYNSCDIEEHAITLANRKELDKWEYRLEAYEKALSVDNH